MGNMEVHFAGARGNSCPYRDPRKENKGVSQQIWLSAVLSG